MGLLNQPRLARTAKQGLMSPLEIQMDTMINDPLRPNLSSRLTQQDLVNKGLLAIGMAPMGITKAKTAYELAHDVASKKAEKMLGLPKGNTAMQRADALFPTKRYHGTKGDKEWRGIDAFNMEMAEPGLYGKGVYTTSSNRIAGGGKGNTVAPQGYATNEGLNHLLVQEAEKTKELNQVLSTLEQAKQAGDAGKVKMFQDWADGLSDDLKKLGEWKTGGGSVYPLRVSNPNPFNPDKMRIKRSSLPKEVVADIENRMLDLGKNPKGKWPISYGLLSDIVGSPDALNKILKDMGYTGIQHQGGAVTGVPIKHTVDMVFNPNQVRSEFAAFDPARVNESDLLAGLAPYLGIGGLLSLGLLKPEEAQAK